MRYAKICPDGEKIAFGYKGNFYYVEKEQSLAIPVTIGDPYEYEIV